MRVRILWSVAAMFIAATLCGCSASPPIHPIGTGVPLPELLPVPTVSPEELERLLETGNVMTEEQLELSNSVQAHFGADASFSGLEWVQEREVYVVWWYGEPPSELVQFVDQSDNLLEIRPTVNAPNDVAAAVRAIMEPGAIPGVQVFGAGAAIDCSKLHVTAEPVDPLLTDSDVRARIEAVAQFPIDLEIGSIVPITG